MTADLSEPEQARSEQHRSEPPRPLDAVGLITLLVATSGAVLIYMGWAYLDGYLRPFSLKPTDLNYSPDEYALYGLNLFSPAFLPWMAALPLLLAAATHRATLLPRLPSRLRALGAAARSRRVVRVLGNSAISGAVITSAALALAVAALHLLTVNTYLLLALVIVGPLLLTWPSRGTPLGRVAFAAAATVSIFCLLWTAALYAAERGTRSARTVIDTLDDRPQVALYTEDTLALNALNVEHQPFAQGRYKHRYLGLRLLIVRGDTYYLIPATTPAEWAAGFGRTFVVKEEDDIRLEILPGTRPA
ncbi:hypothetical protein [Nonomuraea rubra]|uniref:hypothetical protein n=1 Tax=Nonomuraea rubra TaxID=46180 RepID=UPI0034081394